MEILEKGSVSTFTMYGPDDLTVRVSISVDDPKTGDAVTLLNTLKEAVADEFACAIGSCPCAQDAELEGVLSELEDAGIKVIPFRLRDAA